MMTTMGLQYVLTACNAYLADISEYHRLASGMGLASLLEAWSVLATVTGHHIHANAGHSTAVQSKFSLMISCSPKKKKGGLGEKHFEVGGKECVCVRACVCVCVCVYHRRLNWGRGGDRCYSVCTSLENALEKYILSRSRHRVCVRACVRSGKCASTQTGSSIGRA